MKKKINIKRIVKRSNRRPGKKNKRPDKRLTNVQILNLLLRFIVFLLILLFLTAVYFFIFIKDIKNLPGYIIRNPVVKRIIIKFGISDQRRELNKIFLEHNINSIDALLNDDDRAFSSTLLYAYIKENYKMLQIYKPDSVKLSIRYPFSEKNREGGMDLNIFNIQVKYNEELRNQIQNFADINLSDDLKIYFSLTSSAYGPLGLRKNTSENYKGLPGIYFIGDSFTEGLFVNDEDTFVNFLSVLMGADGYAYPYNGGIEGYSLEDVIFNVRVYTDIIKPKMVILVHSLGDVGNTDAELEKIANNEMSELEVRALWEKNFNSIDIIKNFCEKKKIHFMIALYPDPSYYMHNKWDIRKVYFDKMLEFCEKRGIYSIDSYYEAQEILKGIEEKYYKTHEKEDNPDYYRIWGADFYIPFDSHLSPAGHKWFAGLLYKKIREKYPELR
jgi:hypothetical protein